MIEAKLENLIGDKAYDSDKLDEELCDQGIEMIAPHKHNRGLMDRKSALANLQNIQIACVDDHRDI